MAFYKAFLTCAMQLYFPDLVIGTISKENPYIFLRIPSKRTVVSYYGLWSTNGFDKTLLSEDGQKSVWPEFRQIRIEEWSRIPGEKQAAEDGVIRIPRFHPRALQAGIRRGVQLSETILSELMQKKISLTPEQQKKCLAFAQLHSRSLKKSKSGPER